MKLLLLLVAILPAFGADELASIYQQAEQSFIANDYSASQTTLQAIFADKESRDQGSLQTQARAHNLQGLINFQLKNINGAVEEFTFAVHLAEANFAPSDPALHLVRYNLANALQQSSRTDEAAHILAQILPNALDVNTRARFFHLQAGIANAKSQHLLAVQSFLRAALISNDPATTNTFLQRASNSSKNIFRATPQEDLQTLDEMIPELGAAPVVAQALDLFRARGYLYTGAQEQGFAILKDFLAAATPDHPLRAQAEEMLNQAERLHQVDQNVIGVLLPLSGKFAKFGRMSLNATLMALGAFEEMERDPMEAPIRFAFADSGDSPEEALKAFEQLVFEDHAIGVIGPLLSKQSGAVAQRAQEYGVPLFSLSQKHDRAALGSYIFPIGLSPEQQIKTIIEYAIDLKGLERFAIMAPNDAFGDEYTRIFWDAAEARGGKIMAIERYEPQSTDFRDDLENLLGLHNAESRILEMEELNRRKELFASTLKAKGLTRKRMLQAFDLKPLVQFDAVFIADDPKAVGQIAPTFAVLDADGVPFLGINTWNSPEIIQRAGRYVQNSIFVDAFFSQSKNPQVQSFITEFQKNFNAAPGALEVQAYDAAKILINTLATHAPDTRAELQQAILQQGKYQVTSGEYEFKSSGTTRSSYLLTVKGNTIGELLAK